MAVQFFAGCYQVFSLHQPTFICELVEKLDVAILDCSGQRSQVELGRHFTSSTQLGNHPDEFVDFDLAVDILVNLHEQRRQHLHGHDLAQLPQKQVHVPE